MNAKIKNNPAVISRIKRILYIFTSSITHPLIKKSRVLYFFIFLFRFINFHIKRKSKKSYLIIPWINDAKLILYKNDVPLLWNFYWGITEYPDMIFLAHCLKKNNFFIDCGANVGTYSIIASKVVGAKSIAFEPSAETQTKLNRNIELNNIDEKVDVRKVVLSDKIEKLYFTNYGSTDDVLNKVSLNQTNTNDNILINTSTLDNEINISEDFILKIDVEGYEAKLINGAKKILDNKNLVALIIEVNQMISDYGRENREDLHNKITSYGFIPVDYDPFKRLISKKIKNIYSIDDQDFSPNTIYIKDFKKVCNLVKDATEIKIHNSSVNPI